MQLAFEHHHQTASDPEHLRLTAEIVNDEHAPIDVAYDVETASRSKRRFGMTDARYGFTEESRVFDKLTGRARPADTLSRLATDGSTTFVQTTLLPEHNQIIIGQRPVADRRGRRGSPATARRACDAWPRSTRAERRSRSTPRTCRCSTPASRRPAPAAGGAIVAGLDRSGDLAFARVGRRNRAITTGLQPYLVELETRYRW